MKRWIAGALVTLAGDAVLVVAMVPLRTHLSLATPALVLVVPVLAGVAVGGLASGIVAAGAGFVCFDVFFIPPYGTFTVGAAQNWTALAVYVVAMLIVARMVSFLQQTRAEARRDEDATRRLYLLSDLLIGEQPVEGVLHAIATTIHQAFGARWVALLIPPDGLEPSGPLVLATTAGDSLTPDELAALTPPPGGSESVHMAVVASADSTGYGTTEEAGPVRVALTALGRPVGLVAMAGAVLDRHESELLQTYANHAALALERSRLREQAMRTELLEQVDHLRASLMGAVSHDLRTPLASVKTAVSALRRAEEAGGGLSAADRTELLALIEHQSDALDRLVANLLDMTRIQAGALELRRAITPVADVVEGGLRASAVPAGLVAVDLPSDLPPVDVDQLLLEQVVANLLDNAARHSPEGGTVVISAHVRATVRRPAIELSVTDHGPGVDPIDRQRVFTMFSRSSGAGRAGLGLAIAKAFVEAHGQSISVDDAPGGGARFTFTMPIAPVPAEA